MTDQPQQQPEPSDLSKLADGDLIQTAMNVRSWIEDETNKFNAFLKPHQERIEAIKSELNKRFIERKTRSTTMEGVGTAFLQTTQQFKIGDKTAYLDWILEDWDNRGAMLQIGTPQVDAVKSYMDANNGQLPPQITSTAITAVMLRRSK